MRFTKLFPSVRHLFRKLNFGNVTKRYNSGSGGAGKKGLVVCVYENNKQLELTPCGQELDQKCGGKISQQLNTLACELKLGKSFAITEIMDYSSVAISCIGPITACYNPLESLDEGRENVRWGVGAGVALLKKRGCVAVEVDPCRAPDAAAEAAELAAWGFDIFKTEECRPQCQVCVYQGSQMQAEVSQMWVEGAIRARAQNWARCLSDMPANKMTPVDLAQAALDALCHLGVTVEAHDREWIEAQRMRAFLAVARGSCDTAVLLECCYRGAPPHAPPVLLAAKGVTFDSGGLCLKECHSMTENRGSMAGAAVVLAALEIIAKLKLPINVAGVIPICENMVSGQCMKVGDVVTALNGLSIQIENTDMEGRLMMADALVYGQSVYKPSLVIDVATFTHGVLMATGGGAFGCFSNSEAAWGAVRCAGAVAGDRPWRFPLWHYFHKQITNDPSVDLRNQGSGHATPCLGAAFLKNFVCGDWVHMDITGVGKVAHLGAPPYLDTCRMTGRPARTLAVMLQQIARASCEPPPGNQPCTPTPSTVPPCAQQPPVSPPCVQQPPSSPQCGQQPPVLPPCVQQPPTSPPCGQQPPSSPPCGQQPPVLPPCVQQPPTSPPCGQQPPASLPCIQQPPMSPPCGQQPPASPPCRQQPPASPPCRQQPPASPPCVQQPPASPPCGQQPPASPPCGQQPPALPPCGQQPPASPPCGQQPPVSPPCGQQPPGSPPCRPQQPCSPGGPYLPILPTPCVPQPPKSPTCRPPTFPSPGGPCPPPSTPCGQQPPTSPPCGQQLPASPPCGQQPLAPPTCGQQPPPSPACGQQPPPSPACGQQPPISPPYGPSPGGPCPPALPSPGVPCSPPSTPCGPQHPESPPFGQQPPGSPPCGQQPPGSPLCGQQPPPGSQPPTCSSPCPSMPPACLPPGPSPNETCPPSCLPGQPAPCQNYPSRTCVSISLTKHKCG